MKQYTFKDGFKCIASTRKEAIAQHRVVLADSDEESKETTSNGIEFVLIPKEALPNKSLYEKFKKLVILDSNKATVILEKKHQAKPAAKTLERIIQYIKGEK